MLKGTRRPGFAPSSTLNTPIVAHALAPPTHVSHDEMLQFLDKFISERELTVSDQNIGADANATDISLSSALSQLKRLHRDFKGLPPSALEGDVVTQHKPASDNVTKSAAGGTKITFED
ncbi:RPA14 (YDR156W) [Zygosaccharomyces parabailii]|nr:RPA14 (YDR156W) [Zygosaccharomyces parabailii]CDH10459.1 related to DNA-directed RNA polymerase I subunit RPA14 [Zygosaccharomyces bailii ISA1307]